MSSNFRLVIAGEGTHGYCSLLKEVPNGTYPLIFTLTFPTQPSDVSEHLLLKAKLIIKMLSLKHLKMDVDRFCFLGE